MSTRQRNFLAIFMMCILFSANTVFGANVYIPSLVPDALFTAAAAANDGDVLVLADGGIYPNTQTITVSKAITIKTAVGSGNKANVALSQGASTYPSNMFQVNASLTLKDVKFNGRRGTNPVGNNWLTRGNLLGGKIEVDGCEVTRFQFLSQGGALDTLIVTNCLFNGCIVNAGTWGGTWDFQGDAVKYVKMENNTFIYCIFGPLLRNGWGSHIPRTIDEVIIDHNTIYNIDGAHGPTTMISLARKIQFTNNLYINGTMRPQESFSNKWIDFPQNTEIDSIAIGKWGPGKSPYWGVITKLGPSAIWLISIEMVDSAKTSMDMQANNIHWTKDVTDMWTAKGLKKPPIWSYETSQAIIDSTKAYFEEDLVFVNAPAPYMVAFTHVADSCVKMQANKGNTAMYKSPPSPYAGWANYDRDGNALYDLRTKENMDMSYDPKSKSATAGTDGMPLGDINWWTEAELAARNTAVGNKGSGPAAFEMSQNYPNPFNPTTRIFYVLTRSGKVNLTIYDLLGKAVRTLVNESQAAGRYSYQVDASDLSSGIYFYTLSTAGEIETKKMAIVR